MGYTMDRKVFFFFSVFLNVNTTIFVRKDFHTSEKKIKKRVRFIYFEFLMVDRGSF